MDRRHRNLGSTLVASLLVAVVAGGCSTPPVSQATSSAGPSEPPAASASTEPDGSAEPSSSGPTDAPPTGGPAGIPDKPADVTFEEVDRENLGKGRQKVTHELTWTAPEGVATTFTVFGVTECLRYEKRFDEKPCLVRGMRIPKGVQERIKAVDGDQRSTTISWREGEIGGGPYQAVLIRASNEAGDSIFTIVWSADVCFECTF